MTWLEIIRVQSAAGREGDLGKKLSHLLDEVMKGPEAFRPVESRLLRQDTVPGSFAIHLRWETHHPDILGSPLGLNIRETLRAFGLVNHSVWLPSTGNRTKNKNEGMTRKEQEK